jgi:hypothetical protein
MSSYVLTQIDSAIDVFTSMIQHGAGTPRYRRNLEWLTKLRAQASAKMMAASTPQTYNPQADSDLCRRTSMEDGEDLELLGWRTRLIERASQARRTIRTVHLPTTPTDSHNTGNSYSPMGQIDFSGPQRQLITPNGIATDASTMSDLPVDFVRLM